MLRDWHGDDAILRLLNSSCGSLMPLINLTYVRRGGGRPLLDASSAVNYKTLRYNAMRNILNTLIVSTLLSSGRKRDERRRRRSFKEKRLEIL